MKTSLILEIIEGWAYVAFAISIAFVVGIEDLKNKGYIKKK